jgi:hypothetical protein
MSGRNITKACLKAGPTVPGVSSRVECGRFGGFANSREAWIGSITVAISIFLSKDLLWV